ncbi:MAG: pseudouridine synthase [Bacteroidales bacterium]|nr:pseudouridine synthase [Bacteroidales bacterium]
MRERIKKSKDFEKPKTKSGGFSKGRVSEKRDSTHRNSDRKEDSYFSKKRFSKPEDSSEGKSSFRVEKRKSDSSSEKRSYDKKTYTPREDSSGRRSYEKRDDSSEKRSYDKKTFGSRDDSSGSRSYGRNTDSSEKRTYGKTTYGSRNESSENRSYLRKENSSDKKSYKSRVSFADESNSDRPKRRFDKQEDTSSKRGPVRRFDRDEKPFDQEERGERKIYKVVKKDDSDYNKGNRDTRYSDDQRPVRKKRRDINAESEILSEIVENRKRTGRLVEKPKVLSLSYEEKVGPIRLNKYIANAGICSRREADTLIEGGAIMVNGVYVTELGLKVMPTDEVRYGDRVLCREKTVYLLLNKPKDYITSLDEERGRKNVMELIAGACRERIYPVGRLDRTTTGLLLFTNDGDMARKLMHPKMGIKKVYQIELDKNLKHADMMKIADGIELDDAYIKADSIAYINPDTKREVGIEIHTGQNRVVRRVFESLGYKVVRLDRTLYAGLTKKDLPRGRWRFLNEKEVNILKMSVK